MIWLVILTKSPILVTLSSRHSFWWWCHCLEWIPFPPTSPGLWILGPVFCPWTIFLSFFPSTHTHARMSPIMNTWNTCPQTLQPLPSTSLSPFLVRRHPPSVPTLCCFLEVPQPTVDWFLSLSSHWNCFPWTHPWAARCWLHPTLSFPPVTSVNHLAQYWLYGDVTLTLSWDRTTHS